ncbi:hypothetical protein THAOC_01018 [Thalassiosira oceanica]|uniref:Uncharacterized protein n=1 Tax=Thalassiosira oceanica TaxID=159749 RepID=K0TI30_THAOC|nr:hypothetical protein THAOC_01018 [Thalassiosira oceanica]|eukprot:EJK77170.1 hypothetical protein THAOC_01018 [Thalassiosira oceanica]
MRLALLWACRPQMCEAHLFSKHSSWARLALLPMPAYIPRYVAIVAPDDIRQRSSENTTSVIARSAYEVAHWKALGRGNGTAPRTARSALASVSRNGPKTPRRDRRKATRAAAAGAYLTGRRILDEQQLPGKLSPSSTSDCRSTNSGRRRPSPPGGTRWGRGGAGGDGPSLAPLPRHIISARGRGRTGRCEGTGGGDAGDGARASPEDGTAWRELRVL